MNFGAWCLTHDENLGPFSDLYHGSGSERKMVFANTAGFDIVCELGERLSHGLTLT